MKIELEHVYYMPKELKPRVLYVSEEFHTAAHLCPCGCGVKIRTPLKPTEWTLEEAENGPTLYPSIGNWQLPCQSHYWIYEGEIRWAEKWSPEQIAEGRKYEEERRQSYYRGLDVENRSSLGKLWNWIKLLWIK